MASARKTLVKIIILGDAGVGKTSLLQRYVRQHFSDNYKTTIGADFLSKEVTIGSKNVTLQLWDTAGQERFQGLGNAFFRGADACVLVYDITSDKTFEGLKTWREAFVLQSNCTDPESFPFVVIGNKIDQEHKRAVPRKRAMSWCTETNIGHYAEASAKEATGVNVAFEQVASLVVAKLAQNIEEVKEEIDKEGQDIIKDLAANNLKPDDSGCC